MTWTAVNCPQCAAPLPRVALWRSVKCASCGSLITKTESIVQRDWFRQALNRVQQRDAGSSGIACGGNRYRLLHTLGSGEISQVYVGQRLATISLLVTVKLSEAATAPTRYAREAQVLRELQALADGPMDLYFSRLLPEVIAHGAVEDNPHQQALVLRHPNGYWGSLAQLAERFPSGIDPRHAVWIWRRILEILGFLHRHQWFHGDVRPDHTLVNPQDHAMQLIGWAAADRGANSKNKARDLQRSARLIQVLLSGSQGAGTIPGSVPTGLTELVTRSSQSDTFCQDQQAEGLDALLQAEARKAFGPPTFVPLNL